MNDRFKAPKWTAKFWRGGHAIIAVGAGSSKRIAAQRAGARLAKDYGNQPDMLYSLSLTFEENKDR